MSIIKKKIVTSSFKKVVRKMLKDTLLGKDVKWGQYMINGKRVQGAKGIKIVNPASMPGAPLPPTPMKG